MVFFLNLIGEAAASSAIRAANYINHLLPKMDVDSWEGTDRIESEDNAILPPYFPVLFQLTLP